MKEFKIKYIGEGDYAGVKLKETKNDLNASFPIEIGSHLVKIKEGNEIFVPVFKDYRECLKHLQKSFAADGGDPEDIILIERKDGPKKGWGGLLAGVGKDIHPSEKFEKIEIPG